MARAYHLARLLRLVRVDYPLLFLLLALALIGVMTLVSSAGGDAELIERQLVRLLIGFALMFALATVPVHAWRRWVPALYAGGLVLLLLVLFAGEVIKGAQRWLDIRLVRFQPSELLKIATPMLLCALLAGSVAARPGFSRTAIAFVLLALPAALILLQPDLGTAFLVAVSGLFVIFLAGLHYRWIVLILAGALGAAPFIWNALREYQRQRVLVFLDPQSDPLGAGYHIIQSKIAIGGGGLWGKGWMNGTQGHLGFVPERSTDFVFAVFAEEFGFMGVCVLLAVYLGIVVRGMMIAVSAADQFSRLLAGSLTFSFAVYVLVNLAMVSGLLPVVGVPLPLLSYGGTSAATLLASFGILMAISTYRPMMRRGIV
ncbi:MAG: rod shape-determining protein RodA [Gammaproteobacteria bacterium]|nr:rod shape-determining protein RodA [Gammaproteobacteria bacterium]MDD9869110.1 rod shape-determining protein RodA [Gammaproteobacteria bacterium]MDD9885988.1 rod shape-determining protein RodA [Gammaproteobacteria bacterium]